MSNLNPISIASSYIYVLYAAHTESYMMSIMMSCMRLSASGSRILGRKGRRRASEGRTESGHSPGMDGTA